MERQKASEACEVPRPRRTAPHQAGRMAPVPPVFGSPRDIGQGDAPRDAGQADGQGDGQGYRQGDGRDGGQSDGHAACQGAGQGDG